MHDVCPVYVAQSVIDVLHDVSRCVGRSSSYCVSRCLPSLDYGGTYMVSSRALAAAAVMAAEAAAWLFSVIASHHAYYT